jgi:uncharacterized oligopeptide transporter (OPT) family protein
LIGSVLGVSNLYLGLQLGAAVAVSFTACLVALPLHRLLVRLAPRRLGPELSLQEGCVLQATASAAGYATVASLPVVAVAWLLLEGRHLPRGTLLAWTLCTSALGAFLALPLRRGLLRHKALPFPVGTATATLLRALHAQPGSGPQARALASASVGAALLAVLRDGLQRLPGLLVLPGTFRGLSLEALSVFLPVASLPLALGALVGLRLAASLLLGAAVCYGVLVPSLHAAGALERLDFDELLRHVAWPATALLVSASLARLLLQGRVLLRPASRLSTGEGDPGPASGAVPPSWAWAGALSLAALCVAVARLGLGMSWGHAVLALAFAWALTVLACRVTGEMGVVPPLDQVSQLGQGMLLPGSAATSLVTGSLTGNSAAVGADMLNNLKAGDLLGVGPRPMLLAQLTGCALGALVLVPAFFLLVPDASALGAGGFPAPAARQAMVVAEALLQGLSGLHPVVRQGAGLAALAGVALALAEDLLPERFARFLPSPMGVGMAFFLPAGVSLSAFAGALAAGAVLRFRPEAGERWVLPVACGLLTGEATVAAGLAVLASLSAL